MADWIADNETLLRWLGALSIVMFIGSLLLVPILAARLPADYFARDRPATTPFRHAHPIARWVLVILKNLIGLVLIGAGIAMLVLPGQGILTMVFGVLLLDFPGKFHLERALVGRRSVRRALNWMRARRGAPPLKLDDPPEAARDDA